MEGRAEEGDSESGKGGRERWERQWMAAWRPKPQGALSVLRFSDPGSVSFYELSLDAGAEGWNG